MNEIDSECVQVVTASRMQSSFLVRFANSLTMHGKFQSLFALFSKDQGDKIFVVASADT